MRRLPDRTARRRAVLVVAALYGLLLQAFLASLLPPAMPAQDPAVICAAHDGAPADDRAACPQLPCCLAAHLAQPFAGPVPQVTPVVMPWRRVVAQVWRAVDVPPARGPPDPAVSSRGPPAA